MEYSRNKIIKSSIWYVFCNFLVSGIHFIVTPVFARILSNEEYGLYSNYTSWLGNFQIITSLMLLVTLYTASQDYKDSLDDYIASMLSLSGIFTSSLFCLILLLRDRFERFTGIDSKYIVIMFLFLISTPVANFYQLRQRIEYQYKRSVFITLLIAVSTVGVSLILVLTMKDKLSARIYGSQIPNVIINFAILGIFFKKRPEIQIKYWKYALPVSIPYMFHSLGMSVLSSFDRIMITRMCGAYDNSLYSIAYTCAQVVSLLTGAILSAFDPWLLSQQRSGGTKAKTVTTYLALGMLAACIGIVLYAPEVLLIVGGEKYRSSIAVMPPVIIGLYFQFVYSLYATVEQFNKKTIWMAIATALAAASNIILNAIFISLYGYAAAAYTTLACYILLFLIHFGIVRKMRLGYMFNNKAILILGLTGIIISVLTSFIYQNRTVRLLLGALYLAAFVAVFVFNRKKILSFILPTKQSQRD